MVLEFNNTQSDCNRGIFETALNIECSVQKDEISAIHTFLNANCDSPDLLCMNA